MIKGTPDAEYKRQQRRKLPGTQNKYFLIEMLENGCAPDPSYIETTLESRIKRAKAYKKEVVAHKQKVLREQGKRETRNIDIDNDEE